MDYDEILKVAKEMKAKQMPLFRVDARIFDSGDIIVPQSNYQAQMDEHQLRIEASLTRTRTDNKVERTHCVFLFDDIKNTLLFWSKKQGKANVYKVKVKGKDFVHKGDMNYLDFLMEVARNTEDEQVLDSYTKKYWENGFGCISPCYELLVKETVVQEVLLDGNSEYARKLCEEIKKVKYVQCTNAYKVLVNKLY